MRNPQTYLLKKTKTDYGGELLKTRKARSSGRPLDTRNTMHLVLRSSQAKGDWSFTEKNNQKLIAEILAKFTHRFGVKIISMANVGNHLHFQIKLASRHTYKKFINAITGAIAIRITGASRLKKLAHKFWDYRPFTRVVVGHTGRLALERYIEMNQLEGLGLNPMEIFDLLGRYRKTSRR